MADDVQEDSINQPITSKKKEFSAILELWRVSKRDPLEFSQRLANLSLKDLNSKETAP
jgi:hypothetical protein